MTAVPLVQRLPFGECEGVPIEEVVLRTAAGAEARIINWGAVLRDLVVPLVNGRRQRVVLGLPTLADYLAYSPHFGSVEGRLANRLAEARFTHDGRIVQVAANRGSRHALHGGDHGFGRRPWRFGAVGAGAATLIVSSPEGDCGYPGAVTVSCTYRLLEPATLRLELTAVADAPTPLNLCHHAYFNLDGSATIGEHRLTIAADYYTPTDSDLIPTGEIRSVTDTPYDFRAERRVGDAKREGGPASLDVNMVLRRALSGAALLPQPAARLRSPVNGLVLDVITTEPGLQLYDGAKVDVPVPGHDGVRYGAYAGICLEPQHFPDSPNHPHFPDTILRPGAIYRQVTEYRFSI